jgi:sulfide:quinone oxidoreductase
MKELPGDVFVTGQIMPAQLQALAEQGVMTFINNRPDMEAPLQPLSEEMEATAQAAGLDYFHIPTAGGLSQGAIEASLTVFADAPRPIVAFCASGTRSAALWAFAHVDKMGVDAVIEALQAAGYPLEQLRAPLTQFAARAKE